MWDIGSSCYLKIDSVNVLKHSSENKSVEKDSMATVNWDYTDRAATYDKRADYSTKAIDEVIEAIGLSSSSKVADIGAGTGKLCKELLSKGMDVDAVEPNYAMRELGIQNTAGRSVRWWDGIPRIPIKQPSPSGKQSITRRSHPTYVVNCAGRSVGRQNQ